MWRRKSRSLIMAIDDSILPSHCPDPIDELLTFQTIRLHGAIAVRFHAVSTKSARPQATFEHTYIYILI